MFRNGKLVNHLKYGEVHLIDSLSYRPFMAPELGIEGNLGCCDPYGNGDFFCKTQPGCYQAGMDRWMGERTEKMKEHDEKIMGFCDALFSNIPSHTQVRFYFSTMNARRNSEIQWQLVFGLHETFWKQKSFRIPSHSPTDEKLSDFKCSSWGLW